MWSVPRRTIVLGLLRPPATNNRQGLELQHPITPLPTISIRRARVRYRATYPWTPHMDVRHCRGGVAPAVGSAETSLQAHDRGEAQIEADAGL
jgi:hypothetical protein